MDEHGFAEVTPEMHLKGQSHIFVAGEEREEGKRGDRGGERRGEESESYGDHSSILFMVCFIPSLLCMYVCINRGRSQYQRGETSTECRGTCSSCFRELSVAVQSSNQTAEKIQTEKENEVDFFGYVSAKAAVTLFIVLVTVTVTTNAAVAVTVTTVIVVTVFRPALTLTSSLIRHS